MFQSLIYEEKINELAPKVYFADIQKEASINFFKVKEKFIE
jgi:hypothetical protein